jgi:hypothetical protein
MKNKEAEKLVIQEANFIGNPKIPELVEKLVRDKGLKYRDVAKMVYILWKRGVLELSEPKPPSNLTGYVLSLRSLWFWTITALITLTTL